MVGTAYPVGKRDLLCREHGVWLKRFNDGLDLVRGLLIAGNLNNKALGGPVSASKRNENTLTGGKVHIFGQRIGEKPVHIGV